MGGSRPAPIQHQLLSSAIDTRSGIGSGRMESGKYFKESPRVCIFSEIIAAFEGAIHIVYVFRNPADVMASYWRFLHTWHWVEGPKTKTALNFATSAPMGRLLRLQFRQFDTMLDRWANHVQQWVEASSRSTNIHLVKYENLDFHFEDTVNALGAAIGLKPHQFVRPSRDQNIVRAGDLNFVPAPGSDNRGMITDLAISRFPELMARLGYDRWEAQFGSREQQQIQRRA